MHIRQCELGDGDGSPAVQVDHAEQFIGGNLVIAPDFAEARGIYEKFKLWVFFF